MKMSFLKLAFQHLAHPANAFERCLVFFFLIIILNPIHALLLPFLLRVYQRRKTSSQTKKKESCISISWSTSLPNLLLFGLSHYLLYLTLWSILLFDLLCSLCLFTRYIELGSICFTKITRSTGIVCYYLLLSAKHTLHCPKEYLSETYSALNLYYCLLLKKYN